MTKVLGTIIFIFLFQFKFCLQETLEDSKGYCVNHYNEQVTVDESYTHTYAKPELQLCSHGYRYYNCWRDVIKNEKRYKKVHKTVPQTRIECCQGYKNVTIHENVFHCEAICDPPCIQGHCTSPGNCTCYQGYEHQDSYNCVPKCRPECKNSRCVSPGQCDCDSGYDKVNISYCAPHCSKKCVNGVCYKPEECLCNAGYKSTDKEYECEPICVLECVNSTCTDFNKCTCWNGYAKATANPNICEPVCLLECIYGECTAPNKCSCHEGYKLSEGSENVCEPECNNCTNGFCDRPNECTCLQNYTRNEDGQCEPNCLNCNNGECLVPYTCECLDGFVKEDDKCVPYCSSCENGNCTEPDVCNCFDGYENLYGFCNPVCRYGCSGGECVTPDNCSCQGYDRVEENICFPLRLNDTNNTLEFISLQRFELKILKPLERLDLSSIYIKVNCSFVPQISNSSHTSAMDNTSQYWIDCSNIKNSRSGFKFFCIWSSFSSDIRLIFNELAPSVLYNDFENFTLELQRNEVLNLTILFPMEIMEEDENCYVCPYEKEIRAPILHNFNVSFLPCQLRKHEIELESHYWKGTIIGLGWATLVAISILTISAVLFYFRKRYSHDYHVHTSEQQMDEISEPLNPHDLW